MNSGLYDKCISIVPTDSYVIQRIVEYGYC